MAGGQPLDVVRELLEAFDHNGRVNAYLVGKLPARLWHGPPGGQDRTISLQSVRRTFAKWAGLRLCLPR